MKAIIQNWNESIQQLIDELTFTEEADMFELNNLLENILIEAQAEELELA